MFTDTFQRLSLSETDCHNKSDFDRISSIAQFGGAVGSDGRD